ncbi:LrgB family protein [Thalassomonas sp. M1454]|uniref:LrgB family protein n=1 Tax=Thalassomonas sp. M1454 TaxID=2594477 RepID=UPI001180D71D|nr:LrgB family protein [Thalassomonas sp. M1454]TRX55116.1 LrgB family protein [Thalassomonas sp. M1454]
MTLDEKISAIWQLAQSSSIPWLMLTLFAYALAMKLYKSSNFNPIVNPVIISIIIIISTLLVLGVNYEQYFNGGQFIHYLLGPATVALAIPLYTQLHRIKKMLLPITITLFSSVVIGAFSAIYIADLLGASASTLLSIAPKSVTTPVAMGISENIGGIVSLTAGLAVTTGIIGAILGTKIFSLMKVEDDAIKGVAMGLTSHGIGTARAFQVSNEMGAFSGLAMALTAFTTAFLLPYLLQFIGMI